VKLGGRFAAVGLALGAGAALLPAAAARADPLEPSACQVRGVVSVAPKLACPYDVLTVGLHIQIECPTGEGAVTPRSLTVEQLLPPALRPAPAPPDEPQPEQALTWTIPSPGPVVTLTYQARALAGGQVALGDAQAVLEDSAGRQSSAWLRPAQVVVSAQCPGRRPLFLPYLLRPACVPQRQPADVAVVVDRSTSVGSSGLGEAAAHVRGVLDALDLTRDRVALIAFDQRVSLLAPLGSSPAEVESALAGLTSAPGTRLERGLRAATAELTGPRAGPNRRRVTLLITDGVQVGPGDDSVVLAAAAEARDRGITILSLALGSHPNRELLAAIGGSADHIVSSAGKDGPEAAYRALADAAACAR
jgi:Mg-chelatase subunit ChlD